MPRYLAEAPVAMISASQVYIAGVAGEPEWPLLEIDLVDVVEDDFGLEALGMLLHALHQRRALQAFDVARPVVHVGGGHELAALFQAGDQHRFEIGARGVDRGRCSRPGRSRG